MGDAIDRAISLFGWRNWFGKYASDVWNLLPACLILLLWKEWNAQSFEEAESSLDQLQS